MLYSMGAHLDTSKVNDLSDMFSGCSTLTSINLYNFNTKMVKKMDHIFSGCTNLYYIDISGFRLENIDIMYSPFYGVADEGTILLDLKSFKNYLPETITKNWNIIDN